MNRKPLIILAAAVTAMVMGACEKVIDFTGGYTDPELVMVSQPEADSVWRIKLTQSKFFLGNDSIATIKSANFDLSVNGRSVNSFPIHEGGGVFNTGITPHEGDSLAVRITVPDKGTLSASCRIPKRPVITDAVVEWDTTHYTYTEYGYSGDSTREYTYINGSANIKFKIHDPAGEHNYYMVRVANTYDDGSIDYRYITINDEMLFEVDATDEAFDLGLSIEENQGQRVCFSDDRIDGHIHSVTVYTNCYASYDGTGWFRFKLEVYSVSRDLYLYWRTVRAAQESDEIFSQIISEPVQVHCNVDGGIGILGGMSGVSIPLVSIFKK